MLFLLEAQSGIEKVSQIYIPLPSHAQLPRQKLRCDPGLKLLQSEFMFEHFSQCSEEALIFLGVSLHIQKPAVCEYFVSVSLHC
jgi:hypothetical protein